MSMLDSDWRRIREADGLPVTDAGVASLRGPGRPAAASPTAASPDGEPASRLQRVMERLR